MKYDFNQHRELWGLLEALCEDDISSSQLTRLESILLTDEETRQIYLEYIDLHGTLHWDTAVSGEEDAVVRPAQPLETAPIRRQRNGRRRNVAVFGTAASLLIAIVCYSIWGGSGDIRSPELANRNNSSEIENTVKSPNSPADIERNLTDAESPVEPDGPDMVDTGNRTPSTTAAENTVPQTPAEQKPAVVVKDEVRPAPGAAKAGSSQELLTFINQQVHASWDTEGIGPSEVADDAEWIRRTYLDIVGHIPQLHVVETFLKDNSPDKRVRLVDTLLDDPDYVRNWTTIWTNVLIGRSTNREVNREGLKKYLRESFAENRGWDHMVYDFVAAEGNSLENGASNFLLAHLNNEAVPATAITARVFLGMQVQCTQCHDHPFNDWKQNQFWELNSCFQQTAKVDHRKRDPKSGRMVFAYSELVNREEGGPTYYETRRGVMRVAYPRFAGVPIAADESTNRRRELAALLTSGEQPQIAAAFVNRMWAHFFGCGFTRDIDDMGPHSPASHPQLLERLTSEFVASGYDVKRLIRLIVNSEPYQLSSRFGEKNLSDDPATGATPLFSRVYVKSMTAEQVYDSLLIAAGFDQAAEVTWESLDERRDEWVQQFVTAYQTEENDESSTFDGSIPQALMMMNGSLVDQATHSNVKDFIGEIANSRASETEKIRQICLAALSRYPTAGELAVMRKLIREHVAQAPRGSAKQVALAEGLQDAFWAYLNSSEFVLVH